MVYMEKIQQSLERLWSELSPDVISDDPEISNTLRALLFTQALEIILDAVPKQKRPILDDPDALRFYLLDVWNDTLQSSIKQQWQKTILSLQSSEGSND